MGYIELIEEDVETLKNKVEAIIDYLDIDIIHVRKEGETYVDPYYKAVKKNIKK